MVVELKGHTAAVTSVLFRNDGAELLTTSLDATGRLWAGDGKPIAILSAQGAAHLSAFGGSRAAIGGSSGVIVRPAAGPEVQILQGHPVAGLAFLGGGDKVITASDDGVLVWDAADGHRLDSFATATNAEGEAPPITDLAVDQRGGRIAAATAQGRVFIWDSAGGSVAPVAVLRAHTDTVNRVAFTADGRYLLTASNDDTVCIWDTRPPAMPTDRSFAALLQAGQSIVARVFTADQLATIVRKN